MPVVEMPRIAWAVTLVLAATSPTAALAEEGSNLTEEVTVTATPIDEQLLTQTTLSNDELAARRAETNDTAALFAEVPGVSLYQAGGVSSLPAIHGLDNARVNVSVDGMQVGVACPNNMNPPLSYIDPSNVAKATVIAGITPVSEGGDSIAGTVIVDSPDPEFSTTVAIEGTGRVSGFYRSNGNVLGGSVRGTVAGEDLSIGYEGSIVAAPDDYEAGGDLGNVRSTSYQSENHQLTLAARDGSNLFELQVGQQYIPYEAFPNQFMDIVLNTGNHVNGRYEGAFSWGTLEAQAYWQGVVQHMNFLADKGGSANGGMPVDLTSDTFGYSVKAALPLSDADTLRLGSEYVRFHLDDDWLTVPGSMMFGPETFFDINNGRRDRLGTYGEWEHVWAPAWSTLLGVRDDMVWMDTGDVQPYSMMDMTDEMEAMAFNAAPHAKTDNDVDVTALLRFEPDANSTFEFGYARKTRAPTLYERYAWASGSVAEQMVGWFGDGNTYVGNLDLKPETANTLSATASWHGDTGSPWEVKITPYYTSIDNYIGVDKLGDLAGTPFVPLQFANHEAYVYGADLSALAHLWSWTGIGDFNGTLAASWVQGRDTTVDTNLYHLMPPNADFDLEYVAGSLTAAAEVQAVAGKTIVDSQRNEPMTPAYALFNLRGSYVWRQFRFDAGIDNLLDTAYGLPLGGVALSDYFATGNLHVLPGMGRSFYVSVTASL
jgi:iron complex outermembrane receptor protein